jgi:conjugative transfer signal peptidase TraF
VRLRFLIGTGLALTGLTVADFSSSPFLVWNASSSVPIGLYRIEAVRPELNDLALVQLPAETARLANQRGYLHRTNKVLKPVAAVTGDWVCRFSSSISVNGRFAALARSRDGAGRPMPSWQGCHRLAQTEVFLLSDPPSSFDSRYFGPVSGAEVIGRAHRLWVSENSAH